MILVGNKCDLQETRVVTTLMGQVSKGNVLDNYIENDKVSIRGWGLGT